MSFVYFKPTLTLIEKYLSSFFNVWKQINFVEKGKNWKTWKKNPVVRFRARSQRVHTWQQRRSRLGMNDIPSRL